MGFAELLLIGVVGLLVLGPERLPVAVRTVTLWMRQLRRSFNSIKADIERELNADELKQQMHNDALMASFREAGENLQESLDEIERELPDAQYDISDIVDSTEQKKTTDD